MRIIIPDQTNNNRTLTGRIRFRPPVGKWGMLVDSSRPGFFGEVFGNSDSPDYSTFTLPIHDSSDWPLSDEVYVTVWSGVADQALWHATFASLSSFAEDAESGIDISLPSTRVTVPPTERGVSPDSVSIYQRDAPSKLKHKLDDVGAVDVHLPLGRWRIHGFHGADLVGVGYTDVSGPVTIVVWEAALPGPVDQEVTVLSESGEPRPNVDVAFRSLDSQTSMRDWLCDGSAGPTDGDGRLVIKGLLPGTYRFTAWPRSGAAHFSVQTQVPHPSLHIEIPRTSQVAFEVDTSPIDIDVMGDIFVGVQKAGESSWVTHLIRANQMDPSINLAANTRWTVSGVMIGPGFKYLLSGQFSVESLGRQTVTLRGVPAVDCRGTVVKEDGRPALGFWVRARDAVRGGLPEEVAWSSVQSNGEFVAIDPMSTGVVEVWDPTRAVMITSGSGPRFVVDASTPTRSR